MPSGVPQHDLKMLRFSVWMRQKSEAEEDAENGLPGAGWQAKAFAPQRWINSLRCWWDRHSACQGLFPQPAKPFLWRPLRPD